MARIAQPSGSGPTVRRLDSVTGFHSNAPSAFRRPLAITVPRWVIAVSRSTGSDRTASLVSGEGKATPPSIVSRPETLPAADVTILTPSTSPPTTETTTFAASAGRSAVAGIRPFRRHSAGPPFPHPQMPFRLFFPSSPPLHIIEVPPPPSHGHLSVPPAT